MPEQGRSDEERDQAQKTGYLERDVRELSRRMAAMESFRDVWGTRMDSFIKAQDSRHVESQQGTARTQQSIDKLADNTQKSIETLEANTQESMKSLSTEVGSLKTMRDKFLGIAVLWPIVVAIIGGVVLDYLTPKTTPKVRQETQQFVITDPKTGLQSFCTWSGEGSPYCVPAQTRETTK